MKRIKLFTHTDLDGVGCAVVARHVYGDAVDIEYCDYHNVNEKVSAFLDDPLALDSHDAIYITDISVNETIAARIDEDGRNWTLLDHHETALWLNRYAWATVTVASCGIKRSGTELFYAGQVDDYVWHPLLDFALTVQSYDTWDWARTGDQAAKDLNDLFWLIGRDRFLDRFVADPTVTLTDSERMLLSIERDRIDAYKAAKLRQLTVMQIGAHTVGIVFADRYQSELGNHIVTERPDLDFVAMIDPARSVSYRSADGRTHVGNFAKSYGGGGHEHAAGSQVSDEMRAAIIDAVFGGGAQ